LKVDPKEDRGCRGVDDPKNDDEVGAKDQGAGGDKKWHKTKLG